MSSARTGTHVLLPIEQKAALFPFMHECIIRRSLEPRFPVNVSNKSVGAPAVVLIPNFMGMKKITCDPDSCTLSEAVRIASDIAASAVGEAALVVAVCFSWFDGAAAVVVSPIFPLPTFSRISRAFEL